MVFSAIGTLIGAKAVIDASSQLTKQNISNPSRAISDMSSSKAMQRPNASAQLKSVGMFQGVGRAVPDGVSPPAQLPPISIKDKLSHNNQSLKQKLGL